MRTSDVEAEVTLRSTDAGGRETAAAVSKARDILGVEELLEKVDALHPEVVNALDVSFLEDLHASNLV